MVYLGLHFYFDKTTHMIAAYKKFFLMMGVTVLLCLSASVVWSKTKLIPLHEYISSLDKLNGNQYVYTRCAGHFLNLQKFLEIKEK